MFEFLVQFRAGGSLSGEDGDNIDWDTEDELEIRDTPFSSCTDLRTTGQHVLSGDGEVNIVSSLY